MALALTLYLEWIEHSFCNKKTIVVFPISIKSEIADHKKDIVYISGV